MLRIAWVEQEQDYAWNVWLQTLPVVWEALVTSFFQRRQLYITGEVPGLMLMGLMAARFNRQTTPIEEVVLPTKLC
jgi:hypothetical protein